MLHFTYNRFAHCQHPVFSMDKDKEPGSARFGNFINYYSFNPPDRRIELIPRTLLNNFVAPDVTKCRLALDVGCNTGDLTMALYEHLNVGEELSLRLLGIDCDETLIQRSIEQNRFPYNITFQHADIQCTADRQTVINNFLTQNSANKFNIVFVNSVTMWIHLNYGDEGLRDFLRYIASVSHNLLLEPQPWCCYRSAARRMKKLGCEPFKYWTTITWRENIERNIVEYLESQDCCMKRVQCFGKTADWDRELCLFTAVDEL